MTSSKISIGIVGFGFVGKATAMGFLQVGGFDVFAYDPFVNVGDVDIYLQHIDDSSKLRKVNSLKDLLDNVDTIFVCVPTPMFEDGSSDTSIVEDVVRDINKLSENIDKDIHVVIKSTVVPGTTDSLDSDCDNVTVSFNPEFLREETFLKDFVEQTRIVWGSNSNKGRQNLSKIYDLFIENRHTKYGAYTLNHPMNIANTTIKIFEDPTSAEMVKYVANCYMATKISFANEIYQICNALKINYDDVVGTARLDKRLGPEYGWIVPGPIEVNGKKSLGFGLSCYPKDLNALIHRAKELGIDAKVMKASWDKNLEVRVGADRDWEKMKKAFRKKS